MQTLKNNQQRQISALGLSDKEHKLRQANSICWNFETKRTEKK